MKGSHKKRPDQDVIEYATMDDFEKVSAWEHWAGMQEQELRTIDFFKWLNENHADKENWCTHGASLIDTLMRFRSQLLGEG